MLSWVCSGWTVIPDNDNFETRTALFGTNITITGNNAGAGFEPGEPNPFECGGKSVWWTWTAPKNGELLLSTAGSQLDTMLTVFTGDSLTNLALVEFNDTETNTSTIRMNVFAGTAYQMAVDGYLNATGAITLHLELGPFVTPPANDSFFNRLTLTGTHLSNVAANNQGASREPDEPFHADELGGKSLWWTWTAPSPGGLTLTTKNSAIDTLLAVYTGDTLSNLQLVAANDEDPISQFGLESLVTANVTAGTTYQIAVDGYDGDQGDIRLTLDLASAFAVPANDNFSNRITLTGTSIDTNVSNAGASSELGEPMHLVTFGGKSVWWTWTAPSSSGVTIVASNNITDTVLCVYTGTELTNLNFVAGNDENWLTQIEGDSRVTFNAKAGTTYQVAVDGFDSSSGPFRLRLGTTASSPVPANNNFSNRTTITGTNTTVSGSSLGATLEAGEPLHNHSYGGKSVWWKWTAPGPGYVMIDTIGSAYDTLLAVYTGTALSNLVEVASDDESGGNYSSLLTFNTKSNVTYQIAVDGYDGDSGGITLRVRFVRASYALSVAASPSNHGAVTINPAPDQWGKYAPGSVVFLRADSTEGYVFANWTGSVISTNNPLALTMNADKTLTAFLLLPAPKLSSQPQAFESIRANGFQLLLDGPTNYSYALERTSNFMSWTPLQTNLVTSNHYIFQDRTATNSSLRFYRARFLP